MIDKVYEGARIFISNYDYVMNNVFMFDWESDLFGISKSGYSVEIEVKVSRSDFFADFKKSKHLSFEGKYLGHSILPNKFYFACPKGLIKPYEVPSYAGLIYTWDSYASFEVVKKAPFIHRNKHDFTKKLLSKYYNTSLDTRFRLRDLAYFLKNKGIEDKEVFSKIDRIIKLLK